jgi:hypothetical protein
LERRGSGWLTFDGVLAALSEGGALNMRKLRTGEVIDEISFFSFPIYCAPFAQVYGKVTLIRVYGTRQMST